MDERQRVAVLRGAETAEELIGVLTAISVVTKRMATKLAILEQHAARRGGEKANARRQPPKPAAYAHQGNTV